MTLQEQITHSMQMVGIVGAGESPSSDELATGLIIANDIGDAWNGEPDATPKHSLLPVVLNGSATYTLSSRPVRVTGAFAVNPGGVSEPVKVVTDAAEYAALAREINVTANWPKAVFIDFGYPSCTAYVAPLSTGTLYLSAVLPAFTTYAAVSDTLATMAPGYKNLLALELAVRCAAFYGRPVPADVAAQYADAKASNGSRNQTARGGAPAPAAA